MVDIEKVIKGIQECDLNGGLIGNCPYKGILFLLKEQEERLRKLQKDKDKLCLEISEWKHKFHDRQIKEQDGIIPYIDIDEAKCPVCKTKLTRQELLGENVLYEDFFDYCPHCGKPVLWEGR
jgi:predicted  nucleic acid-binding Zn-ribbon protein